MSSRPSSPTKASAASDPQVELSLVVDDLLNSLQGKFSKISSEMFAKMDEMSRRLDALEEAVQANAASQRPASPKKA